MRQQQWARDKEGQRWTLTCVETPSRRAMFGGENPTQEVTPTLVHEDGNTGVYHRVTGVSIDTGGIGYTSQATVTFNGAQGNDVNAEGIAIMDFVSGKVKPNCPASF